MADAVALEVHADFLALLSRSGVQLRTDVWLGAVPDLTDDQAKRLIRADVVGFMVQSMAKLADAASTNVFLNDERRYTPFVNEWENVILLLSLFMRPLHANPVARWPSWVMDLLRPLRTSIYDIMQSMFKHPAMTDPLRWTDSPTLGNLGQIVNVCRLLMGKSEMRQTLDLRTTEAITKYCFSVWYPRRDADDPNFEATFLGTNFLALGSCLAVLTDLNFVSTTIVRPSDFRRITSLTPTELIQRALELSQRKDLSPTIRVAHLGLIQSVQVFIEAADEEWLEGTLVTPTDLVLNDCWNLHVVNTISVVLSEVGTTAWLDPAGSQRGMFPGDRLVDLWVRMMQHASRHRMLSAAVESAESNVLEHIAAWTVKRGPATVLDRDTAWGWAVNQILELLIPSSRVVEPWDDEPPPDDYDASTSTQNARLLVRVIGSLTRARELVDRTPGVAAEIAMGWKNKLAKAEKLFDELGEEEVAAISRCAGPSCERAWGAKGGSLLACSGCRKVEYCSVTCQKAAWKTHKPSCKARKS